MSHSNSISFFLILKQNRILQKIMTSNAHHKSFACFWHPQIHGSWRSICQISFLDRRHSILLLNQNDFQTQMFENFQELKGFITNIFYLLNFSLILRFMIKVVDLYYKLFYEFICVFTFAPECRKKFNKIS